MENEKKFTETNENSLNKRDYSREFSYLNQIKWLINFNLYEQSTFCESNFCKTIARYIDSLQKKKPTNWEKDIQDFINSIKNFKWSEPEKLKYLEYFFGEKKIIWFKSNWWQEKANNLRRLLNKTDLINLSYKPNSEWKIDVVFPWMIKEGIPERYYTWTTNSGFEDKVIRENRSALAKSIREQREKANGLQKLL